MTPNKRRATRDATHGAPGGGDHGPAERTARDGKADGIATASDAERAQGAGATAPTTRPAPPPRDDENPQDQGGAGSEEFRDAGLAAGADGGRADEQEPVKRPRPSGDG